MLYADPYCCSRVPYDLYYGTPDIVHRTSTQPTRFSAVLSYLHGILQECSEAEVSDEGLQALCALALYRTRADGNHRELIGTLATLIVHEHQKAGLPLILSQELAGRPSYNRTDLLRILDAMAKIPEDGLRPSTAVVAR